jgi:hypothetical protein
MTTEQIAFARFMDQRHFAEHADRTFYLRRAVKGEFAEAMPAQDDDGRKFSTLVADVPDHGRFRIGLYVPAELLDADLTDAQLAPIWREHAPSELAGVPDLPRDGTATTVVAAMAKRERRAAKRRVPAGVWL